MLIGTFSLMPLLAIEIIGAPQSSACIGRRVACRRLTFARARAFAGDRAGQGVAVE